MARAQIEIGKRTFEEIMRLFDSVTKASFELGTKSHQHIYDWNAGCAPSAKYLQRLHYCGADVIYILTGMRSKNELS